jgi:hypothetical protein
VSVGCADQQAMGLAWPGWCFFNCISTCTCGVFRVWGSISFIHACAVCFAPINPLAQATYDVFMATNPTLEAFEAELKKYMAIETEIASIPSVYNIGAASSSCRVRL